MVFRFIYDKMSEKIFIMGKGEENEAGEENNAQCSYINHDWFLDTF